jgi:hypothetical protein
MQAIQHLEHQQLVDQSNQLQAPAMQHSQHLEYQQLVDQGNK